MEINDTKVMDNGARPHPPSALPESNQLPARPTPPVEAKASRKSRKWLVLLAVLALVGAATAAVISRITGHRTQAAVANPGAPMVSVARVTREDLFEQLELPAEFRPYLRVDVHAKVSGYVTNILVDIGDRVKAGQLLAQLEVPELNAQLDQAIATEQRAQADHKAAHLAYTRLRTVLDAHPNLVAQQELDSAEAKDLTTQAAIAAAKAEVERYQTLMDYTRITAPFDGVITHRYADPGSLIQAGTASDTQSMPLVRLSDNYRLRLDIPVSVANVKDIRTNQPVTVRVDSLRGKTFSGTIARFTQDVDDQTRTMITEVEVPNPKLELVPGMYASVVLRVDPHMQTLALATEAVSADRKGSIYVVNGNNEIEERKVTYGLETPTKCEVLSGLKEGDLVVTGNRGQLRPGQKVMPKVEATLAQQ